MLGILLLAAVAAAAPLDAKKLVEREHMALEPARASTRTLTIVVNAVEPEVHSSQLVAGQARKKLADGQRILTVMLAPYSVRGMALLVQERDKAPDLQWIYVPALRRVRQLEPVESRESFLNTDFTFADLGFVRRDATFKVLGTEKEEGTPAVRIEAVPHDHWYYSRIVTTVAEDSALPIRREFFDPAGLLWKVQTWSDVTAINGTPIPLRMRMQDVRQRGSTEIRVSDVLWDRELPDDLFDPHNLPQAAASPVWSPAAPPPTP